MPPQPEPVRRHCRCIAGCRLGARPPDGPAHQPSGKFRVQSLARARAARRRCRPIAGRRVLARKALGLPVQHVQPALPVLPRHLVSPPLRYPCRRAGPVRGHVRQRRVALRAAHVRPALGGVACFRRRPVANLGRELVSVRPVARLEAVRRWPHLARYHERYTHPVAVDASPFLALLALSKRLYRFPVVDRVCIRRRPARCLPQQVPALRTRVVLRAASVVRVRSVPLHRLLPDVRTHHAVAVAARIAVRCGPKFAL